MTRSLFRFVAVLLVAAASFPAPSLIAQQDGKTLPMSLRFKGKEKFDRLVAKAKEENWVALPLGERTVTVGKALLGTPYTGYTLEIDDKIEATSANLDGLDCWTFFETSLAFARMLKECQLEGREPTPADLLAQLESDRYRGGVCTGEYLSRLHFLEEWMDDNEKRGLVSNVTRELGGVSMGRRNVRDMSAMWKHYRYLKATPSLVPQLKEVEKANSALDVYYIPKGKVKGVEDKIQSGDVICITTSWKGSYTSHVGLAYRDSKGRTRFMHATSTRKKGKKVIIDDTISGYLYDHGDHSGIYVARPKESLKVQAAVAAASKLPPQKALPVDISSAEAGTSE